MEAKYRRTLEGAVGRASGSFPVLLVTGPRQVGKTTLLEMCAEAGRRHVTLDDLDARSLARDDPGLFIQTYQPPVMIDEVQYAPELFSYLKIVADREKKNGLFWLTGSQKFHLMRGITESLAGRVAIIDLLGLSQAELEGRGGASMPFMPTPQWIGEAKKNANRPKRLMDVYEQIWRGSFPRVNSVGDSMRDIFYRSYIQTYIQRDVKDVLSISDETSFHRFLGAAAARTGQLLNYAKLAGDVGIDSKTVKSWLSVLETSGLIYLLKPFFRNVTKRLVKAPKLYFLDTGLAAHLCKWPTPAALEAGAMSGAMLETHLFGEILKSYWHNGEEPHFYYYRDADQREVDLVIETGEAFYPVEFKKTATPSKTASRHFRLLEKLGKPVGHGAVLCFVDRDIPLSASVTAVPIAYL